MKKISMLFFAVVLFASMALTAQTPKVTLKFSSAIEGSDDPNIAGQGKNSFDLFMLGNKSKLVQSAQGMSISVITDGDAKNQTILMESPMGNYYLTRPEEEIQEKFKNVTFNYDYTAEEKNIAGYVCKKVVANVLNNETDEEESLILYVTEDLPSSLNFTNYPNLNGFPMRTEMAVKELGDNVIVVLECEEVVPNKKLKPVAFVLPEATDVRTDPELYENFKSMFGGGEEE